ncbi:hypothetical protein VTK73DRAFT_3570 [Phialemonium thermophilum]|uniref:Uncharacterized protein n=1 Tax=Phialemonium thermophilum TaxID=223376 RepID=A0ABR3WZ78_9PEZI
MVTESKKGYASSFDADSQDVHLQSKVRLLRTLDAVRVSLTVLALLMGVAILAVSADALSVYNATHVPADFYLPLWPDNFDLRPTVALLAGSSVVVVVNTASLLFSRVQSLRNTAPTAHLSVSFAAPLIGLIAAVVAMTLFYAVNASHTVDTLLSWTCRWSRVAMQQRPHFGSLCRESHVAVYLSILLIPVEAFVLGVAAWQRVIEGHTSAYARARKASPVISS